jgi:hypothetical protein
MESQKNREKRQTEGLSKEILPHLMKNINIQIQEVQ